MRKMVLVAAILALAGCGEGRNTDVQRPKPPTAATVVTPAVPQWHVEVYGQLNQAVSDLAGWLIEHSYVSTVVTENGKARILLGPFSSKAEAEAKQAEVAAALTKAKKQHIDVLVVEYPAAQ